MTSVAKTESGRGLERYLDVLFGRARRSTLIEVRWRLEMGMGQRFARVAARDSIAAVIVNLAAAHDVYVGVLPRWRPAGGRAAIVGDCRTVWIDLDTDVADRVLEPVDPAPTLRVASGGPGHLHVYWSLRVAAPPRDIERANRRLAWALGGDLSSADAPRILRPPQTLHHGRSGAPVTLVDTGSPAPCRLADLVGGLADPPIRSARPYTRAAARRTSTDPLLSLAPERYVRALTGQRVGRTRKVRCPLHEDRTPSLHVYEDPEAGWFCFGCRRGGTVYDLAGALWLSGQSAGEKLRGREFRWLRHRLAERLLIIRDPPAGEVSP